MARLHIFIDGSWLFKVASPQKVLASKTENPMQGVAIDFDKLNATLLQHVQTHHPDCTDIGDKFLSTSIFELPANFDNWPSLYPRFLQENLAQTKRAVFARTKFVEAAVDSGYSEDAIYRPPLKDWMLDKLMQNQFQEKQVDATVVALLVRSAIINPDDYHCVLTGDADVLPAIRVAYPQYSKNVFVAATHPDELQGKHRATAFSLNYFKCQIPPLYLQDHVASIIRGNHVYVCAHCHKIFARSKPLPVKARPCCNPCNAQRT
jgi:hypothetical protein